MKLNRRRLLPAIGLLCLAIMLRFWIAPLISQLPDDYSSVYKYKADDRFRTSLTDAWQTNTLIGQRLDQTLSTSGSVTIIQGSLDWRTEAGELIFTNRGLYGIDRTTRTNLSGYGDVSRHGQFLFPRHVKQISYTFWDPLFIGALNAEFDRVGSMDNLTVYIFNFSSENMDESAGYENLQDVPERYYAHTDGKGTLWIEPISGILVDYQEQGVSYFIDPVSLARLPETDFHIWSDRFTPATNLAQLILARTDRLRILTFETWLPAGVIVASLIWIVLGFIQRKIDE